jgi:hypothetical protein
MESPLIEGAFAALSSARGRRVFHPDGSVHVGRARLYDVFPGCLRGEVRVELRLSRAFGLPSKVGDFYGLAVRVYRDQAPAGDLLFATSFLGGFGKWVPRPHRQPCQSVALSSLLPYATTRGPRQRHVLGAEVTPSADMAWEMMLATDTPPAAIRLWSAPVMGRPRTCGYIDCSGTLAPQAADSLRFSPWNAPPGLRPAGVINRIRDPAYRGSQRGRA